MSAMVLQEKPLGEQITGRLGYLTPIAGGLFAGRLISEWIRPGLLGAISITILSIVILSLLLRRPPWYPWILSLGLLVYIFYPEANPRIAIIVMTVSTIAILLSIETQSCFVKGFRPGNRLVRRLGIIIPAIPLNVVANLVVTLFFLVLYITTLAPGILPADSGEFQLVATELGVAHPPGFPLYTLLAHLVTRLPFAATPAYKVNLFSALTSAITLFLVYLTVYRLRKSVIAAATSAITLGASTTFWAQSTTANIRSLTVLFTALLFYLLVLLHQEKIDREDEGGSAYRAISAGQTGRIKTLLVLFALSLSFGITHHASLIFMGFIFCLYLLFDHRRPIFRYWPWLIIAALAGLLPLGYLLWRGTAGAVGAPADLTTVDGFINHVLALGFRGDFFYYIEPAILLERLRIMGDIMIFQFSPILLAFMLVGTALLLWCDRRLFFLIIGALTTHLFVAATYRAPQTVEYLMPAYVPAVVVLGFGLGELRHRQLQLFFQRDTWSRTVGLFMSTMMAIAALSAVIQIVDRHPSYAWLHVNKDARDTSQQLIDNAPAGSVILADWHWATSLWYLQTVEARRPDVTTLFVFPESIPYGETWAQRIAHELEQGHPVISTHYDAAAYSDLPAAEPLGEGYLFRKEPMENVPTDFQPLDIKYDRLVHILGYNTSSTATEVDQELVVEVAWQPIENSDEQVSLFLHLVSRDGKLLAAQDNRLHPQENGVSLTQFRLTPLTGSNPGDNDLVVGAYTNNKLADERGHTSHVIGRHRLVPSSFAPFTQHLAYRPIGGSQESTLLVGYDWDQTLPGRYRLYLHWRAPDGYFTQVEDITGKTYTMPDWSGPWGISRSGTKLEIPDSEFYVPMAQGIVWLGDPITTRDEVTPGGLLVLQPIFGSGRPVVRDLIVSLRLVGYQEDGELWDWWDLDDSVPAMGAIPTLKWIRGSRVRSPDWPRVSDEARPGQEAGPLLLLYDSFTGRVLPILDAQISNNQSIPMGRTVVKQ